MYTFIKEIIDFLPGKMKNKKTDLTEKILWIFMILQIVLVFWCNLKYMPKLLDGDFAKLATHIIEMASNKQLAIDGWKYTTTAEWDCAVLFALPLYMITKNVYLALSISNLIISVIYCAVCFLLFGKNKKAALISANLLLIPYEFGILSYFNMLFYGGSQYSIKVLVPLLMMGVSVKLTEYAGEKKKVLTPGILIPIGCLLFLIFLTTASSGIYVCMCGLFPAAAAFIVIEFDRRGKLPVSWIITAAGGLALAGLGFIINNRVMGGTRADSLTFVTFKQYAEGYLTRAFFGFFSVFGASTTNANVTVTSVYGVFLFLRIIFVLALIIAVIASVKKMFVRQSLTDAMLLAVFFWDIIIIAVTDVTAGSPTFEYRYYLIGVVPALLLFAERISELFDQPDKRRRSSWTVIFLGFLVLMLIGTYRNIVYREAWEGDVHSEYRQLVTECNDRSLGTVYIYDRSHETDICRLLTESTQFLDVLPNGVIYVNDYYAFYETDLTSDECYVAVPEVSGVFEDGEKIFDRDAECILTIGSIKLYRLASAN